MAPFSVIVFGVVVWTIAVSGSKQLRFRLNLYLFQRQIIISLITVVSRHTEEIQCSVHQIEKGHGHTFFLISSYFIV